MFMMVREFHYAQTPEAAVARAKSSADGFPGVRSAIGLARPAVRGRILQQLFLGADKVVARLKVQPRPWI
jgi:hypothetical protein